MPRWDISALGAGELSLDLLVNRRAIAYDYAVESRWFFVRASRRIVPTAPVLEPA